nr:farnesylcysteine lyase [Quercus suber]
MRLSDMVTISKQRWVAVSFSGSIIVLLLIDTDHTGFLFTIVMSTQSPQRPSRRAISRRKIVVDDDGSDIENTNVSVDTRDEEEEFTPAPARSSRTSPRRKTHVEPDTPRRRTTAATRRTRPADLMEPSQILSPPESVRDEPLSPTKKSPPKRRSAKDARTVRKSRVSRVSIASDATDLAPPTPQATASPEPQTLRSDTPPMRLLRWAVVLSTGRSLGFADQQIVLADDTENTVKPYNVAIVGAGAAGSSSAYHLSKYAAEAGIPVNITIFERNTYIGGRSTTTYAYGEPAYPVELGASIFVEVNQILVSAVDEFNLSTSASQAAGEPKVPGAALAVWDGKTFVVSMNSEGGWWDIARLLWKYGLAPIRTINLMKATVVKFSKMYTTPIFPFTSLGQAVQDVGLLPVTASTGEQYMLENGITGAFGHDVVQASTRVNYAQNLNRIHGLEAMVCMATDGAMAVAGGNWQIFEQMVLASRATILLETAVTEIRRERSGHYALSFSSSPHQSKAAEETEQNETQDFDTLILASPLQFSNISFSPPLSYPPDRIPYVRLHVTLFTSRHLLSPTFFGLPSTQPVPKVILTTTPSSPNDSREVPLEFFSISLLRTVINPETEDPEYLYKIFSPTPLSRGWIVKLLGQQRSEDPDSSIISWLETKVWDSYPYEFPRVTFDELQFPWADAYGEEATTRIKRLNGTGMNWYYTSSIESFISTMETCALMGKNVAAIIVDAFKSREGVHTGM